MLSSLLRFELNYHFKQVTFKIAAILFLALGMLMSQGVFGGDEIHKNSPYVISYIVCLLSMCSLFVSTLFCAGVVLRDTTYQMDPIIFTTSLQRRPYFLVRLLGLLTAVFFVLAMSVLGIYLGSFITNPQQLGPFKAAYFLQPLFVFGLPNVLFCSSVVFSVALLTRNTRAVYITGVVLFILYLLGSILGNSPFMASSLKTGDPGLLPYLLDPFGITSFFGDTRSWSDVQRNEQLYPVKGVFLANRLLWMGIALLLLLTGYRYFKFRQPLAVKSRSKKAPGKAMKTIPYRPVIVNPKGFIYHRSAFVSQLKLEAGSVFGHIAFGLLLALWVFLNAIDLKEEVLHGPYGIRFYAASGYIAEQLRSVRPALLLLVFYAAEMIGRERASNMQGLVFSTPVPNTILWGAKCTTLAFLSAVLITANIFTGIGMQLFTGFTHIEWPAYLSLYIYSGIPLFLFGILIVFIQTLIPHKYAGMLLSLVVTGVFIFGRMLGIHQPLLRYAGLPDLKYSGMNGFGHYAGAANWYLLYWVLFATILSLLAAALWQGSTNTSLWQRVRSMGQRWGTTGKLLLLVCGLAWIATGTYIYRQASLVSTSRDGKDPQGWQVDYEKKYKPQSDLPQPQITAVSTNVDLYPQEARYTVKGTYRLKNETGGAISTLWLGVNPEVTRISFSVPNAVPGVVDATLKQYWYTLKAPLLPGMEMSLQFSMEVERSGFTAFNSEHSVVSNGSYIELEKYVPFLGYNDRYETGDPAVRRARGLPVQTITASTDSNYHLIDYETEISTAGDQRVITVGSLQKIRKAGGRNYFHYKTEQPIAFMFALSSARYAVREERYKNIALAVYYQPGQSNNVPAMMLAMKDAIDYGNAHFSPYPLQHLTLAEIPHYPGAATAYPGVLFSAEKINFMSDYRDSSRFNNTYSTTAHEVAHQWWANKVAPLDAPGRAFLTESLAKYTEAMVVEKRFGKPYLRKYLQQDNDIYFALRYGGGQELPLARTDQTFVYYQKGGLALYALKDILGETRMDECLQQLVAQHAFPGKKATVNSLFNELYKGAAPGEINKIDAYLKQVIVYDNRLKIISCDSLPNGQYRLQLQVSITKKDEGSAQPRALVPQDRIDIAVFDRPMEEWNRQTQPVYLQAQQFSKAATMLTLILNKKPAVVILDPWVHLPDADLADNVQVVK